MQYIIFKKETKLMAVVCCILASVLLGACGGGTGSAGAGDDNIQIVTTIFPEYDWVKNILGENPAGAEVTLLLDNGVDMHSYQPTAEDILKISSCDIFIYVGGESDEWVEDVLKNAVNKNLTAVNLLDILGEGVKEEEMVEGMEEECEEEEEEEAGPEYDEHVWLSLKNAAILVDAISVKIQEADPDNAEVYKKNTETYISSLNELDREYEDVVSGSSVKTLLFGDRFPFRYLTDDYGITYYAAFAGCSAETEASFGTITFLAGKVDELGLTCVMTIEGSDHKIAETIAKNTSGNTPDILTLDSMQSTTLKDAENGTTYLSVTEGNLEVLKKALD